MVQWWVTLIGLFLLLLMGLGVFFYAVRAGVDPEDAHVIDPLPEEKNKK
ncbi:hypothetical protein ACFSCX_15730 [Bacillus salitolerans]|uniref:YtzI protein n=1 Tax=Bacillus salitolerans TaxID=1437434 RepID=A0ABW4LSD6_9BACI